MNPGSIETELYTDKDPAIWRTHPWAAAAVKPLAI